MSKVFQYLLIGLIVIACILIIVFCINSFFHKSDTIYPQTDSLINAKIDSVEKRITERFDTGINLIAVQQENLSEQLKLNNYYHGQKVNEILKNPIDSSRINSYYEYLKSHRRSRENNP